jgi:hypothetical protein
MIERRSGAGLTAKTFQSLGVSGHVLGQEFQRNGAAELGVFGFIHHAHAAATEFARNLVVRKGLPDHRMSNLRPGRRVSQFAKAKTTITLVANGRVVEEGNASIGGVVL